ncbi:hypothetical protein BH10PSE9_BH10PSE9_07150 [soil metagenome]
MRQRPKPFTVEVKKSRKANAEPQSLFGNLFDVKPAGLEETPAAAPERGTLFNRPPVGTEALALADQVFGAAPLARAETRILPDLTARAAALPEEQPRRRAERVKASPKPRAVKPKPIPIEIVARAPVVRKAEPLAVRPLRVRPPRRDDGDILPRGERWKRRLSPFAR